MESKRIKVLINRVTKNDSSVVNLDINELDNLSILLTDSCVNDIELLFNRVFDRIIEKEKLIEFYIEDNNNDLYKEVTEDIFLQINSEIKQSESDLEKIIAINKEIHRRP